MPSRSDVKTLLGSLLGYGFLLLALLAALFGIFTLAFAVVDAPVSGVLTGAAASFGVSLFCLFVGVTVRKVVTGTVLSLDVDTDKWRTTMFRGGQG